MKILSPYDNIDEVRLLADAGADELYGGVLPDSWRNGDVAVNRRSFARAQFASEAEFARSVELASSVGLPVHLTLNAPFYHRSVYDELVSFAGRALGWGVESLIASDPGLLARVREAHPKAGLTLSTMAGAMNREALAFYKRFGLVRAVLPRHLSLAEFASVVASSPDLLFEAFVLVGKCPNEEAYCSFQHNSPAMRWPCEIPYRIFIGEGCEEAEEMLPQVSAKLKWMEADRRMGCGLCAVPELRKIGIKILKLVGRGGPTKGKVANVELARRYLEPSRGEADARADYQIRFGRPCVKEICYFPEVFRSK